MSEEKPKAEKHAIVVKDFDVAGTALEMYGGRSMVRELATRLLSFHPAARDVGEAGMLAAAQLAILVGANPLPSTNEIHIWKNEKRNIIQIDLGINYFRRRARELGGIYWVEQPRIMTDSEYQNYGVDARQEIGAIATGARLDEVRKLLALGLSFDQAVNGQLRVGIGTVSRSGKPKEGRPLSWTALKAAEKDLARSLFPNLEQPDTGARLLEIVPQIEPQIEPSDEEWPGETLGAVEAENLARLRAGTEQALQDWNGTPEEDREAKQAENSAALYGDHDEADPFGEEFSITPEPAWEDESIYQPVYPPADETPIQQPPEPEPEQAEPKLIHPANAGDVREYCRKVGEWVKNRHGDYSDALRRVNGEPITKAQQGSLPGLMSSAVKRDGMTQDVLDKARYDVMDYLFGVRSTGQLTKDEAHAIIEWLKEEGEGWGLQKHATREAAAVLAAVSIHEGQLALMPP